MRSLYGAIVNYKQKEIMVSVNNVYQKVLALANKEQRGYITPQEFNLFADQAQLEIFEQYFYDLEQRQRGFGNKLDYANIQRNIEEKISLFEQHDKSATVTGNAGQVVLTAFQGLYRLGVVRVSYQTNPGFKQAEQVQLKDLQAGDSPLTMWTNSRPVYVVTSLASTSPSGMYNQLTVYPNPVSGDEVKVSYIKKPESPNWTYIITNGNALFDPSPSRGFRNFQLHSSEENRLVIKVLQLAGVAIKDFNLAQLAGQKEASNIQQEKQ